MLNLVLILNHRCNFYCSYCQCKKENIVISHRTAILGIELFFGLYHQREHLGIKFCGGEPLLDYLLLKKIIRHAEKKAENQRKKVKFEISSNGFLLDEKKIVFFEKNRNIKLSISLDGQPEIQIRNRISNHEVDSYKKIFAFRKSLLKIHEISINMVISPDRADHFFKNFLHIRDLGFSKINFLPAYFVFWSQNELKNLRKEFAKIASFLKKSVADKERIKILNKNILSPTPLANQGLIVDCNGDVFLNNIFLLKPFSDCREYLKIGNILNGRFSKNISYCHNQINNLIKMKLDPEIYHSTYCVDKILTEFVLKIQNETS